MRGSGYPDWLREQVGEAIYDTQMRADGEDPRWEELAEWAKGLYCDEGAAVLDSLGMYPVRGKQDVWHSEEMYE